MIDTIIAERNPPQTDTYPDRNLALLHRMMRLQIRDPERFGVIPEGASLVVVARDDPAFTRHNLAMALALVSEGRRVFLLNEESLEAPEHGILLSGADAPRGAINATTIFLQSETLTDRLAHFAALLRETFPSPDAERRDGHKKAG